MNGGKVMLDCTAIFYENDLDQMNVLAAEIASPTVDGLLSESASVPLQA
jgi:hypothetical protein